ncbi:MAG TPA: alpha-mannosidase, partial [Candidatus Sericytochromatia bacterium]
LAVLHKYIETFDPEKLPTLATSIGDINWAALPYNIVNFENSLNTLRQNLIKSQIYSFFPPFPIHRDDAEECLSPIPPLNKQVFPPKISLLGHAHLDMAWLWSIDETWEAAQRTFESVLKLQQQFPELTFCHSTPALYAWIEEHRPDLFTAIQQQVNQGRWEIVGGMWIEPELNIISGESIVRQILYGQHYVLEKFGQLSKIAWLPDSFGFCATLPQFLKLGGIEYFVTQKLRWNDTTQFPHSAFLWQSPDGTEIFSLMSAPIGEGIDPIKMANYSCEWQQQTSIENALWLPGVGDHGGGPTRDMLEVAQRWQQSPFFPEVEFTTASNYLSEISNQESATSPPTSFPIWKDELYLEFHRGCYTTHTDQKLWNRRCEQLLYEAELFATFANITTKIAYPKAELEAAWKKMLFNQFHDILPGTSIPEVFVQANKAWQEVEQVGNEILDKSLSAIASRISLPTHPQPNAIPIVVFNSLNCQRSEVVNVSLPQYSPENPQNWQIYDLFGKILPSQVSKPSNLLFLATDIPSVGYRVFWLVPESSEKVDLAIASEATAQKQIQYANSNQNIPKNSPINQEDDLSQKDWVLENEFLRVTVDPQTGNLISVFDKNQSFEILQPSGGNQLQAFQDSGQYWDAWNIDPNYTQHPLPPTILKSITWVEKGKIQQRLRVVRQLGKSEFCQDYLLSVDSPLLKIVTTVDWQERQVLIKAAFPINIESDFATYQIPCGTIQRLTKPATPEDKAKWEVPALHWADISNNGYGVSLLNNCKYGYDCQPDQLRLTLLRSASWPDPQADIGIHEFTYALYPHSGNWQSGNTVRRGYELNLPLRVMVMETVSDRTNTTLKPINKFLDLQAENLILMAFKQSEYNPQQWILRCYECHGETAQLQLNSDLGLEITQAVDLLERPLEATEQLQLHQSAIITPNKIVSFTGVIVDNG